MREWIYCKRTIEERGEEMSHKNEELKKTGLKAEKSNKNYKKPQLKKYKTLKKVFAYGF